MCTLICGLQESLLKMICYINTFSIYRSKQYTFGTSPGWLKLDPTEARWMTWLQPVMEATCCLSLSSSLKWHLNVCGHYWLKTLNSYLITYKFLLSDISCEFKIYPWKWFTHQLWFVFNKKVQTIMHSVKRAESINRIRSWWLSSFLVEHL